MRKIDYEKYDEGTECPYASPKQLGDDPIWPFSEASLRYLLFNSTSNGLEGAICRVGKKLLIHKGRFLEWIESQPENKIRR